MGASDQEENIVGHHQEDQPKNQKKNTFISIPFIIANESFEKAASYGLLPNMIVYLMKEYNMTLARGQNIIFFWTATSNFLPLVGAFLADSYLGRFLTIALGSIFSLLGMTLLWMTTVIPGAKPPMCDSIANNCAYPTVGQYALLVIAFLIMSIGAGGVRPCSLAFGADQVDQREDPKNKKQLETFFYWYYACGCFSVLVAMTVIVYIQDHIGWSVSFGIPVILMFLSTLCLFLITPYYVMNKVKSNLFNSLVRVGVSAFRNRKISLPPHGSRGHCYLRKSTTTVLSERLRFLNKACIIQDFHHDIGPDGLAINPWKLCTVEEVEELKALIRVLPIWTTGVIMSIHVNQGSFAVLQALTMDRHLGLKFKIPAASFALIRIVIIVLWIPIYDRVLIPLASRMCGKPISLSVKLRMGIGLFCAFMSMLLSGIVENIRRKRAIAKGFTNNSQQVLHMSAFILVPQFCFSGLAEAFNGVGQNEFFYTVMPKSMSSIATCLFGVGMGVASLLASVIMNLVNVTTQRGGKDSWISSNINKAHFDYYYWILAVICFLNVLYYILCSWCFGPIEQRLTKEVPLGDGKGNGTIGACGAT